MCIRDRLVGAQLLRHARGRGTFILTLAGYDPERKLFEAVYDNGHREQLTLAEVGAIARVQYGGGGAPPVAGERSGQTTADAPSPSENGRAVRQRCN